MERLEKIIGSWNVRGIVNECERILRLGYQKSYSELINPDCPEDGTTETFFCIDQTRVNTITAIDILINFRYLDYTNYSDPQERALEITAKGKDLFDNHFRKEGEYFNEKDEFLRKIKKPST
jgi:hypothetical protein